MIVSELMGGLGNQMFQYAIGKQLAIKNKTDLFLDTHFLLDRSPRKDFSYRNYDLSIFNIAPKFAPVEISKKYGLSRSRIKKYLQKIINPGNLQYIAQTDFNFVPDILNSPDNIYLSGYWQTEKYFKEIETILRADFSFKNAIGENTKELVKKINGCNAVCLHVRRGDFVTNPTHGTPGIDYYTSAEIIILQKITNPVFFIFSDEIDWCKENIHLSSDTHYVGDEFTGEKCRDYFELMTLCKHFIIPNSSFGWWAAWLSNNNNKVVIAPRIWFKNSSWNTIDLIPDTWIKI
jgi:hypothetical protein